MPPKITKRVQFKLTYTRVLSTDECVVFDSIAHARKTLAERQRRAKQHTYDTEKLVIENPKITTITTTVEEA